MRSAGRVCTRRPLRFRWIDTFSRTCCCRRLLVEHRSTEPGGRPLATACHSLFIRKQRGRHQSDIIQPDAWPPEGAGGSLDAVLLHSGPSIAPRDRGVEQPSHWISSHRETQKKSRRTSCARLLTLYIIPSRGTAAQGCQLTLGAPRDCEGAEHGTLPPGSGEGSAVPGGGTRWTGVSCPRPSYTN
jgi:hypothetical protein